MEEPKIGNFSGGKNGTPIKDGEAFQFFEMKEPDPMEEQAIELPPTAWITVVETSQGPSSQVNWTKMRGVKHHPLYTADQVRAAVLAERERCASVCDSEAEGHRTAFGHHCAAAIRKATP